MRLRLKYLTYSPRKLKIRLGFRTSSCIVCAPDYYSLLVLGNTSSLMRSLQRRRRYVQVIVSSCPVSDVHPTLSYCLMCFGRAQRHIHASLNSSYVYIVGPYSLLPTSEDLSPKINAKIQGRKRAVTQLAVCIGGL